jgi:hypothetical protein
LFGFFGGLGASSAAYGTFAFDAGFRGRFLLSFVDCFVYGLLEIFFGCVEVKDLGVFQHVEDSHLGFGQDLVFSILDFLGDLVGVVEQVETLLQNAGLVVRIGSLVLEVELSEAHGLVVK